VNSELFALTKIHSLEKYIISVFSKFLNFLNTFQFGNTFVFKTYFNFRNIQSYRYENFSEIFSLKGTEAYEFSEYEL